MTKRVRAILENARKGCDSLGSGIWKGYRSENALEPIGIAIKGLNQSIFIESRTYSLVDAVGATGAEEAMETP